MFNWKAQIDNKEKKYYIQIETDDYEKYRRIEDVCHNEMQKEDNQCDLDKIGLQPSQFIMADTEHIPDCCKNCMNHPSNGGSGICNCTLPQFEADRKMFGDMKKSNYQNPTYYYGSTSSSETHNHKYDVVARDLGVDINE